MRTFDAELIGKATQSYAEAIEGFTVEEWLSNPESIALAEGEDVAMFERQKAAPTVVYGHYFFKSRGKEAVRLARSFIKEIFTGPYNVNAIVGLTPLDHKAAIWMTRHLGFKFDGEVDTADGPYLFSILTKQEWEQLDG